MDSTYVTYLIRIFIYDYMRYVLLGDEFVHQACEKKNRNRRPLKLFRLRKYNISLIAVETHVNPSAATANGAGSVNYFSRPEAFVTEKSFGFILIIWTIWTIWTLIGFLFWRFMQLWKWLICITPLHHEAAPPCGLCFHFLGGPVFPVFPVRLTWTDAFSIPCISRLGSSSRPAGSCGVAACHLEPGPLHLAVTKLAKGLAQMREILFFRPLRLWNWFASTAVGQASWFGCWCACQRAALEYRGWHFDISKFAEVLCLEESFMLSVIFHFQKLCLRL